jgi:hypothetical protein
MDKKLARDASDNKPPLDVSREINNNKITTVTQFTKDEYYKQTKRTNETLQGGESEQTKKKYGFF